MNDLYNIKKGKLSLQIEALIYSCLQRSFAIGSRCIACTTTHFDSRSGLIAIDVIPFGANPAQFEGRISFLVTCTEESRDNLVALNNYLHSVHSNGYSRFTGLPHANKAD